MYPEICQATERRLVRKLNFRLLPTLVIIFIIKYMDSKVRPGSIKVYSKKHCGMDMKIQAPLQYSKSCDHFLIIWILMSLFLTPGERRLAQAHLAEDAGEADQYSAEVSVFDQDGHERYQGSTRPKAHLNRFMEGLSLMSTLGIFDDFSNVCASCS
ncbi:uncharacterized protein F5147DRAFT_652436 [Suillus discolor]|uniref:Uncharacterized protein n=1 Tax=Suillus discolor TaxID=1912936 RepID=A0A9P7F8I7_9AGAM|nr:uncharacterized protein F5147DRAFT_652436 [Suillus discolor]KAG2109349.1 hypothetical protein F5147DRAFT_652436 [Suillus discolor]